jgi:hypothetical protein
MKGCSLQPKDVCMCAEATEEEMQEPGADSSIADTSRDNGIVTEVLNAVSSLHEPKAVDVANRFIDTIPLSIEHLCTQPLLPSITTAPWLEHCIPIPSEPFKSYTFVQLDAGPFTDMQPILPTKE